MVRGDGISIGAGEKMVISVIFKYLMYQAKRNLETEDLQFTDRSQTGDVDLLGNGTGIQHHTDHMTGCRTNPDGTPQEISPIPPFCLWMAR
jgi:hypothetical protein